MVKKGSHFSQQGWTHFNVGAWRSLGSVVVVSTHAGAGAARYPRAIGMTLLSLQPPLTRPLPGSLPLRWPRGVDNE